MQHPAVHAFMIRYFTENGHPAKGVQKKIAEYVGVSPGTVSKWFAGSNGIDPSHWRLLAQCAGLVKPDGTPDVDAVAANLAASGSDEPGTIALLREVRDFVADAAAEASAERQSQEAALLLLTEQMTALTVLVTDAIAARAAHNGMTQRKPPAKPSRPRSTGRSTRSRS